MPMRITNQMITNSFMQNLRTNLNAFDQVSRRWSTGKEISRPSDDPVKLQQILKLDTALNQRKQYIRNIDDADSWLTATDAALKQVGEVVIRVKELGVKASNGTNDADSSNAIALEIGQLLQHLGEVSNTVYAGRYLFAGGDTEHQPYNVQVPASGAATIDFTGQTRDVEYEIGQDAFIKVNATGQDAFGGKQLFAVFDQMRLAILNQDSASLQDSLGQLDHSNQTLLAARADVGARMNRLEATKNRYEDDIINMTELRSRAEDADMAQVVMELKTKETVYQAALAAGAKIIQPSLLDYLR